MVMVPAIVMSLVLSLLATTSLAQTPPAPGPAPKAAPATKSQGKKPASKATAKPADPAASGPCVLGVIPVIGDTLGVQTVGLTVFGNSYEEVPVDSWGLGDIIVAKIRAVTGVRRIAYAKGAFEPYDNPPFALFRDADAEVAAIVRQIAGSTKCERYIVIAKGGTNFAATNQTVRGISFVRHIFHSFLYVVIQVMIFDGQSFAIHRPRLKRPFEDVFETPNIRQIDNESFPRTASAAANDAKLRTEVRTLLAGYLDKVLPVALER